MAAATLARRACSCCCYSVLVVLGLSLLLVGALLPPSLCDTAYVALHTYGVPNPKALLAGAVVFGLRDLAYCFGHEVKVSGVKAFTPDGFKSVYLGCLKTESTMHAGKAYGWTPGVCPQSMGVSSVAPLYFSHAGYKEAVYNPKAGRPMGMFLLSNKSKLPPGVVPDRVDHVLLEYDTGHPEWRARRMLMRDGLAALGKDQPSQGAIAAPGVSPQDGDSDKAIQRVLGVTLFKWLFDIDVSDEIESILEYDELFAPVVFGQYWGGAAGGARLAAIRSALEKKVKAGSSGQKFLALASERGMDAEARLQEVIWIVLFAAFGGTSNYAIQTVKHILRDPAKNIPLFRKSTEAFMLEAARVYPPVGGMNFMELREPVEIKTLAGGTMRVEAGEFAMSVTSGANNDPTVFDTPSEFRPGRTNADRIMTWNAELRDIRAGTAPRGCPGTHFALRLATAVVSYFVDGVEKARGQAGAAQEL